MKNILYLLLFVPFTFLGQTFLSIEQDIPLELSEGWNMFGFSCYEPMDAIEAFSPVVDKVIIVKDNSGAVYMTEFGFNGIGNLQYNQGYQIKTTQAITDFQFCPDIIPVVEGCMEEGYINYNPEANVDSGNCEDFIFGCMDSTAFNFNHLANQSTNFTCYPVVEGCLFEGAYNYNDYDGDGQANALTGINGIDVNTDDGSCVLSEACPYDIYIEYSADAQSYNVDLCQTLIVLGCMDEIALNFNLLANTNDGSCQYLGCMDSTAFNYYELANTPDYCQYIGCMDTLADNYDPQANEDDGSCIIYGCTLADFPNYNSEATADDFSCDMSSADVFGCIDPSYLEYDPSVNQNNGTCSVLVVYGCTGPDHCNYNPEANTDDGSCIYPELGYDCEGNFTPYIGMEAEGGIVFYVDETGEHGLVAALEDLGQFQWGCDGYYISGADGMYIGQGLQNTLDIVTGCSETPIAASEALAYESAGYSDWHLPSRYELLEMYNTIGNGGPEGNIGGFSNSYYWSSSENNSYGAWYVGFNNGAWGDYYKTNTYRVRVIRAF